MAALSQLLLVAGPILSAFAEMSDEAPVTKTDLKDELMTVKEVAERMHVNFRTVYTRLASGAYPGQVRDGRMVRVSRLAFEKWLKNRAA